MNISRFPLPLLLACSLAMAASPLAEQPAGPTPGGNLYESYTVAADSTLRIERASDREAVRAAVLDYVDALYEVDPRRIERSVHPHLAKRGFWRRAPGAAYEELLMSYAELHDLAARWNRRGQVNPESAVKEIVILDLLDRTASAKLTAEWGTDYLHLAKYGDRWQIVHVLWQSPPEPVAAGPDRIE